MPCREGLARREGPAFRGRGACSRAGAEMMFDGAQAQLLATVSLWLALMERGIGCAIFSPADEVPFIRVAGLDTLECVGLPDGTYEIWTTNAEPPDPVPVMLGQSLDQAVQVLSQREGRA